MKASAAAVFYVDKGKLLQMGGAQICSNVITTDS